MTFEDAITAAIKVEMEHIQTTMVGVPLDQREYDRRFGGYHALRLLIEELIPDVNKKLNER